MTDDEFLAAFASCRLPRADWTHAAHVRLAWLQLTRRPFADALAEVRAGIRRYNASVGSAGYHETITAAFTAVIADRLGPPAERFADFQARCPELFDRTLAVLHRHYSPERLKSAAAKEAFVAPDRQPLPGAAAG